MNLVSWRQRLYASYVSSGQGGRGAEELFRPQRANLLNIIEKHVPQDRSVEILDLGCGAGGMLFFLKQSGYKNISGVDFSAEMIALAHEAGVVEARVGDLVETLVSAASETVDVVFIMDVLEHLPAQELFDVGDQIARVLRPGGKIILHVPNASGIFGSTVRYGDLTHERAFNANSISQFLRTVGFVEIQCFEEKPNPHGVKSLARSIIWHACSFYFRLLNLAETGAFRVVLSRNMLATAIRTRR